DHTPVAPSPAPRPFRALRTLGKGHRRLLWAAAIVTLVLLLLVAASHAFDGPLRRTLEAKMNQSLHGYTVTLGAAHFGLASLSLTLRDLVIRQSANPEPPVAAIPRFRASVQWSQLLTFHLVGDILYDHPHLHIDLPQLERESADRMSPKERGWQQALESIFPLKANVMRVVEGDIVYVDKDPRHPLEITHWQLAATNIRNISSRDRVYPSPVHTEGAVFATGHAVVDGHADFLAQPYPGVQAGYRLDQVPLDRLAPIITRFENVTMRGGTFTSHGEFEASPKRKIVHVADATIRGLHLDYNHSPATATTEKARGRQVADAARKAAQAPTLELSLDDLHLLASDLGVIDHGKNPAYRLYVDHADLRVTDLTNRAQGHAVARLRGRFMGSGTTRADLRFRPSPGGQTGDFDLTVAVERASLPAMNDILRAYGKFDVAAGLFSGYSEVHVRGNRFNGYIKPFFQDVQVYSPAKDQHKPLGKKIYEHLIGAAAKILENRKQDNVATRADLSGSLDSPRSSLLEILGNLIRHAFIKAILPGFDRETSRAKGEKG
nr:DUF748 domain-containing protein [Acidobacteriota bacterium]